MPLGRRHWTHTAKHLGGFADSEIRELGRQLEAVLKRNGVLPAKAGEYSLCDAYFAECAKARTATHSR